VKKISASYIFPGKGSALKNGILVCSDDGTILEVIDTKGHLKELPSLEYYTGILMPGFINTHCHLELSYLKGKIREKTGVTDFIGEINRLREEDSETIEKEIEKADHHLFSKGIAATGDISNSIISLKTKLHSNIYYHTFVETFGFHPSRAEKSFRLACHIENIFNKNGLSASVVPHSPYSVSTALFKKIKNKAKTEKNILSIHNQESPGETEFYQYGTGPISDHLKYNLRIDISHWKPTGKSSLISVLPFLPAENQLLLVHNIYTSPDNISEITNYRKKENTFFVICPNANLYIENRLPPLPLFQKENLNICIGTDSLASNHQLSVLAEMITLQQNFNVTLEELTLWACYNGARALKTEKLLGSFEPDKKPGINLITGVDLHNLKLTESSKVTRLI
jgi:aminodeoxyfutalosine deaminase